jgi:UDP-GlcNAc:undecaprenyl-phosphate GlcNAc-1-phosphate transferase
MSSYLLIFGVALLVAFAVTPMARKVALRTGIVDQPNSRKVHLSPVPLLGGAAMYLAVIVALILFGDRAYVGQLAGIFLGATFVSLLGIWDDRQSIPALFRLAGQVIAAAILIWSGVQVAFLPYAPLNWIITILWVVGITNAMNLLDNMDGLAAGVGAVGSAVFLLLAAMNGQYLVGIMAAALLGACIGFLYYNLNPSNIFMGDGGSLFLGFVLAAVGIKLRFNANVDIVTWMVPVTVLGIPIMDTTLVVVSRLRRRLNPLTTPGKDHISHRLVARGWAKREAALALCLTGSVLGFIAVFLTQASVLEGYVIFGGVVLIALAVLVTLERDLILSERQVMQRAARGDSDG